MTAAMQAGVFRLYPNREQAAALARWCGAARWLWNELLRRNQERYDAEGKFLFAGELSAMLPAMKREHVWLADPPAISLVDVTRSLDLALRDFLRRKTPDQGFPRFKRKRWGEGSVYLTGQGLRIEAGCTEPSRARGRIKLPKIGWCRIRGGRWPNGRVVSGTIRRDSDRWHVSLRWEGEVPDPLPAPARASIGVDMGLKDLAAASDGKKDEAPKHMRRIERRLKRAQRRLSRREKERQNRRRQAARVRRLHRIVRNRRRDHLHKISRTLTAKAALVCVEGLSVKAMAKGIHAKSVGDTGLGELRRQLEYKAAWHGRQVVRIGRFDRSTGVCPDCGAVGPMNGAAVHPLRVREWTCAECGEAHDRDIAAARVIELRGLQLVGRGTPEPTERRTRGETGGQRRGRGLRRGASRGTANAELDHAA